MNLLVSYKPRGLGAVAAEAFSPQVWGGAWEREKDSKFSVGVKFDLGYERLPKLKKNGTWGWIRGISG